MLRRLLFVLGLLTSTLAGAVDFGGLPCVNVKDAAYGATGDGVTDDVTAVTAAQDAVVAAGRLCFPAGTYLLSGNGLIIRAASGTTYVGAGMYATTIKSKSTITNWLSQTSTSYKRQNITFEDMTFDTDGQGLGAFVGYGEHIQNITFRRCRFLFNSTYGISLSGVTGITIEDSEFHGYATSGSSAINITGGSSHVVIRNNKFRYGQNHIVVDTGVSTTAEVEDLTEQLVIEGNDMDMGWWLWPSTKSNSGGTVTYTGSASAIPPTGTLTDSGGGFNAAGLVQYDTKRVLAVNDTGTIDAVTSQYLEDAASSMSDSLRGDIVRSGTKFAVITGVKSATNIRIEGWLDSTSYLPVAPPAVSAAFTTYKVYHFVVDSWTDTAITTYSGFWNGDGVAVVPAAGTLYELYTRPNYQIHTEYSAGQVRISNNSVRRGWSDQISVYGNRAIISGNFVEDGEDMGITLNGTTGIGSSIVSGNKVRHQGANGIFTSASNSVVSGNVLERITWVNHHNLYTLGGIQVLGATGVLVTGNVIDGASRTLSRAGIGIQDTNDAITVSGNYVTGTSVSGIVVYGAANTNIELRNNRATLSYQNGATAVDTGSGTFTVTGASRVKTVTFASTQPNTSYYVSISPATATTGTNPGATRLLSLEKTTAGFTVRLEKEPGADQTVTFDYMIQR
jgi:hypothetical protein